MNGLCLDDVKTVYEWLNNELWWQRQKLWGSKFAAFISHSARSEAELKCLCRVSSGPPTDWRGERCLSGASPIKWSETMFPRRCPGWKALAPSWRLAQRKVCVSVQACMQNVHLSMFDFIFCFIWMRPQYVLIIHQIKWCKAPSSLPTHPELVLEPFQAGIVCLHREKWLFKRIWM